ncbi:expressed unknown protein [Seminavis robusta]|uniref:Uncharacterized protein n=1 Tax=Seminavis robusta TaxID=568900 RepID=A0A9N8ETW5_9STRA|nr:expressed unknown protein [Seminavis robusta]|eukprot:Sro1559_g282430.1 n/a (354) ;mRNA; r:6490-7551
MNRRSDMSMGGDVGSADQASSDVLPMHEIYNGERSNAGSPDSENDLEEQGQALEVEQEEGEEEDASNHDGNDEDKENRGQYDDEEANAPDGGVSVCSGSEIEEDDSVDSADFREEAVRKGFLDFLLNYIGCGIYAKVLDWLTTKIIKIRGDSDDAEAELQDLAGDAIQEATDPSQLLPNQSSALNSGGSGGGGGGGAAGNSAMMGQMATSAAQGAAGATATASASVAGGVSSAVAGLAGLVASTGVASQVGVAVGVAAVTAAAVSAGVGIVTSQSNVLPAASPRPMYNYSGFVPPECNGEGASTLKIGQIELQIQGFPPDALPERREDLEILFRDLYNEITVEFRLCLRNCLS